MAAVDQHISYIEELHTGDVVTIRTTLIEFKEKSLRFTHEMFNAETSVLVARTTLKGVNLDTVARKSCPVPDSIASKAASMLGTE
jgi:acyl-CoA thioester hydrolase